MRIYLVQRGTFRKIDRKDITGIDSAISFDYMGSSEFEWGAKGKSLARCIQNRKICGFRPYTLTINNEKFYLYSKVLLDNGKEVEDFMNKCVTVHYPSTKEMVNIHKYFEGEFITQKKQGCLTKTEKVSNWGFCNFWWDLENDWMLCPEKYKPNLDIALQKLEEQNFVAK